MVQWQPSFLLLGTHRATCRARHLCILAREELRRSGQLERSRRLFHLLSAVAAPPPRPGRSLANL